jgi:hypothetical protein
MPINLTRPFDLARRHSCRLWHNNKARANYTNQRVPYFYAKRLPAAGEG